MNPNTVDPEVKPGSFFSEVMEEFKRTGYRLSFEEDNSKKCVLNAANYGTPQNRERFILIGVREGPPVTLPKASHGPNGSRAHLTLGDVLPGLSVQDHQYLPFPAWSRFLASVPPGGCWKDLPPEVQREAMGGAFDNPDDARTRGKRVAEQGSSAAFLGTSHLLRLWTAQLQRPVVSAIPMN